MDENTVITDVHVNFFLTIKKTVYVSFLYDDLERKLNINS